VPKPRTPHSNSAERGWGDATLSLINTILINLMAFLAVAIGGGLGSAWYMVEAGSRLSTRSFGPWTAWTSAGRPDADPYTRAHTTRNGLLPISSTLELSFRAKSDSGGARLHSACEYGIVIEGMDNAWWSLAAFDAQGRLVPNAAERYAFTVDTAMREPDGRVLVTLARDARPGNWLPIGGGSRVNLVLTIQDPAWAAAVHDGGRPPKPLPEIQRVACR
jgi:hypothetical protein